MTLRLTREEADWLARVMRSVVGVSVTGAKWETDVDLLAEQRRNRDVATGMLGRLEEGK
jgi:hypothetical protein